MPYLYGSRISPSVERHHRSHERIHATLVELFPALAEAEVTHRWGGVLAVPRNWTPFVHFDRAAGTAGAGGYVGEGVAPSNLAGRTLADLITGTDSERVDLPWVGVRHRSLGARAPPVAGCAGQPLDPGRSRHLRVPNQPRGHSRGRPSPQDPQRLTTAVRAVACGGSRPKAALKSWPSCVVILMMVIAGSRRLLTDITLCCPDIRGAHRVVNDRMRCEEW